MTQSSISRRFPATMNRSHGRLESLERSQSKRVRSKTITIGCCNRPPNIPWSLGWVGMEYWANLRSLGQNARVFAKLSEVPVRISNRVPKDVSFYKDKLDSIWDVFGEDHVLFGSDWPNSDHLATYAETLDLVRSYVST